MSVLWTVSALVNVAVLEAVSVQEAIRVLWTVAIQETRQSRRVWQSGCMGECWKP